jgi:CelD/BcsL family acetyltransferase involved in cellulose biosynthesis
MVDAVHAFESRPLSKARPARNGATHVTVAAATGSALAGYRALSLAGAVCAPAQGFSWVEHWIASTKPDPIIAILNRDGEAVMALALEVVRKGPFRVARFMSGTHANGNFALSRPSWLPQATCDEVRAVVTAIAKARPDVDMIALERLLPMLDGVANPLAALPNFAYPNVSLACDLNGGFDELLKRSSGKRKRKKYRSQVRKYEAAGGHQRIEAKTPAEVNRLLDAFFAMKAVRFKKAGIRDVFGDQGTKDFFRKLFIDSLGRADKPFLLHALEVGGTLRAVTGSSRRGKTLICEFGAIIEDELAHASPGDFLFFENIREACESGFAVYDFSVGDEPYKRLWCDIETTHVDALVPLTTRGRVLATAMRRKALMKAYIKSSPLVWKIAKTLRRKAAKVVVAADSADD